MKKADSIDRKIVQNVFMQVHCKVRDPADRSTYGKLSKDAWKSIYNQLYRVLTQQIDRAIYIEIVRLSRYENK